MDNYENNNMDQMPVNDTQPQDNGEQETEQTVPAQEFNSPAQEQPYRNIGAGRKESPFADSPYVMNHQQTYHGPQTQSVPPVEPKPVKPKKKSRKVWRGILAAVMVAALVATGCGITAYTVNSYWTNETAQLKASMNEKIEALENQIDGISDGVSVSGSALASEGGLTPGQVYAMNQDAVVAISALVSSNYGVGTAAGSGFILTEDGYVVTNYHVVEGASSVSVITNDEQEYAAEVVGYDATNDIAVLKVDAADMPHVTLGSSDDLIVGDQVVAVGNALGELSSSMTVGYISGKDRDVTTDGTAINMLQTDAAINSGNSGGPLFNMKGEVVGITTAKYSGTTSSGASIEGIGFAIPIDDVIGMIQDLTQYGYITGAYLGVLVSDMDSDVANTYGLPVGAYVQDVTDGYCAQAAGVQAKDIIVALGDYEVGSISELTRALRNFNGGDITTITVYRSGAKMTLTVTLDEKPRDTETAASSVQEPTEESSSGSQYGFPFFGGNG